MAKGKMGKRKGKDDEKNDAAKGPPKKGRGGDAVPPWLFSRWLIVVAAIIIQLSLGAIYAWSVFTPPLSAPLPDDDFNNVVMDEGVTVQVGGELSVGKASNITFAFTRDGAAYTNFTALTVSLELRDKDNKPVEDDKVVQFVGIVYKEGNPIMVKAASAKPSGDHYYITPKVTKPGNWHFLIHGTATNGTNMTLNLDFEVLQKVKTGTYGLSISQTQLIFAVGLLTFAVFTVIGGRLSARFGPRKMAMAGGLMLGAGYIAGSFMENLPGLIICIGVIGGAGIGFGYVVPIAVGVKWFPDKKGLISGLAVAGFGFGALLWMKLCTGFVFGPIELSGDWPGLYGSMTVSRVFLRYGMIFAVSVFLAGLVMQNPPEGWKPAGWNPPEQTDAKATGKVEFTPAQMRRTPQYWMLFVMLICGASAGLMVIGVITAFGKYALIENGFDSVEATTIATTAFALFYSISNGLGRIIWGGVSDKIGRKWSFMAMFGLQGIMMISFFFVGGYEYLLYAGAAVIGFNFGGNFALFPSATADFFGNKSVGMNYGWVLLAYGLGGLLGPMLGGIMGDMEYWMWAFVPAGIACLFAASIAFFLKPPKPPEDPQEAKPLGPEKKAGGMKGGKGKNKGRPKEKMEKEEKEEEDALAEADDEEEDE